MTAGRRSSAGRSTAYDGIPDSKVPAAESLRPCLEASPRHGRKPRAVEFRMFVLHQLAFVTCYAFLRAFEAELRGDIPRRTERAQGTR